MNADPAEKGQPARILLGVDDIDAAAADATSAGAEVSPIETYESVMAWAEATGPAHQRLSLVQIKL